MLFLYHPKCSTCQKALAFLRERGLDVQLRDIRTENPSREELALWQSRSGLPLRRFFNTSGMRYRALGLKDKTLTEAQQLDLLCADGMLVRRPLLVRDDLVLVGFRPREWEAALA